MHCNKLKSRKNHLKLLWISISKCKQHKSNSRAQSNLEQQSPPEGNWKNNTKDGNGTQYFHNGDKYVGQWKNNQMEGNGTYTQSNGNIYHSGLWKNSKPYEPPLSLEELAEKSNKKLEQALNCYRYIDNPNSKKLLPLPIFAVKWWGIVK